MALMVWLVSSLLNLCSLVVCVMCLCLVVFASAGQLEVEPESRGVAKEGVGVAGGEEPDGSTVTSVEEVLGQLSLENLVETFHKEQIDLDSLVSQDLLQLRWGSSS